MSENKFTPGPWEPTDLSGQPVNDPAVMSEKHCIATVWINDISRKQAVANARLIAEAPVLAESLADMLRIITAVRYTVGLGKKQMERVGRARAALSKATGAAS